jgi:thioredoxin-dependent peroxiredoxin
MSLKIDQPAPTFSLPADDGSTFNLQSMRGKRVLLVFYPADESPVCTAQLCEYRDGIDEFIGLNAEVIGISAQNSLSHQQFKKKRALPFVLLSDSDLSVAKLYGATALFRRTHEQLIDVLKKLS